MTDSSGVPFAVWLVPDAAGCALASQLIRRLASRFGAPQFHPHLTLVSGRHPLPSLLHGSLSTVAGKTEPISLPVTGVGGGAEYFRTLYLTFETTPALARIHEAVRQEAKGAGQPLFPHLSLLYADLDQEVKRRLVRELESTAECLLFDSLWLVSPSADGWMNVAGWETLARFSLRSR